MPELPFWLAPESKPVLPGLRYRGPVLARSGPVTGSSVGVLVRGLFLSEAEGTEGAGTVTAPAYHSPAMSLVLDHLARGWTLCHRSVPARNGTPAGIRYWLSKGRRGRRTVETVTVRALERRGLLGPGQGRADGAGEGRAPPMVPPSP